MRPEGKKLKCVGSFLGECDSSLGAHRAGMDEVGGGVWVPEGGRVGDGEGGEMFV